MKYINGIPLIWDEAADKKLLGRIFPAGLPVAPPSAGYGGAVTFEKGFNDSPFGPYWDNPQTVSVDNQGNFQQLPKSNKWLYKLIQDADGLKLIDRYKKQQYLEDELGSMQDEETDIHIYYEKNDGYNNFGTICLVRMNIALHNYVSERSGFRSPSTLANSIVAYNEKQKSTPDYLEMDAEKLTAAIEYELNRNPVIDAVAGLARKYASNALHYLADWIREGKYQEKNWNPNAAGYDPLIEHNNTIAWMVKNWKSFKQKQGIYIDMAYEIMEMLENNGLSQSAKALETIAEIWQTVIDFIDAIMGALESINMAIEAVNGFLCGFINAFVDLIAGVFDLIATIVILTDSMDRAIFKETLENLVQDYIQHPGKILDALKEKWEAFKERYKLEKTSYEIAYQLGEDAFDLLALLDGIKLVINLVRALPKMFKNMVAWMERLVMKAKRFGKSIAELEYAEIAEKLKKLRFEYIDKKVINAKWKLLIQETRLSTKRVLELAKKRSNYPSLSSKNLANMKVKVFLKGGGTKDFEYLSHAGRGKKIPNSVGAPDIPPTKDFLDLSTKQNRWYDSENKMLVQLDKDLKELDVYSIIIKLESTFTPCTICRREILLRKKMYNAKVFVESSRFKNPKGRTKKVKRNSEFEKLLEQLNK